MALFMMNIMDTPLAKNKETFLVETAMVMVVMVASSRVGMAMMTTIIEEGQNQLS